MMKYLIIGFLLDIFFSNLSAGQFLNGPKQLKLEGKIFGGELATMEKSKYVVSIGSREQLSKHICGGSLISKSAVLSAAHCFLNYDVDPLEIHNAQVFFVVLGTLTLSNNTNTSRLDLNVLRLNIHKGFNIETIENDIAILILDGEVPNNYPTIDIIQLANKTPPPNSKCEIYGWGSRNENDIRSDVLMAAEVSIVDATTCVQKYGNAIQPGMICAGDIKGKMDACRGDSGGPLVFNKELVGTVSWGQKCADANYPGIYSEVAYFKQWINEQLNLPDQKVKNIDEVNYLASIRLKSEEKHGFGNGHICAGAVLSTDNTTIAVTAAKCLYEMSKKLFPNETTVVLGTLNRFNKINTTSVHNVTKIVIHPDFRVFKAQNYLAKLYLSEYIPNKSISIYEDGITEMKTCKIYGWNAIFPKFRGLADLQTANTTAYSFDDCKKIHSTLNNGMFCAGSITHLQDEIQPDTGGVLICDDKLAGILTKRFDSALLGYPPIYVKVSYYMDWILGKSAIKKPTSKSSIESKSSKWILFSSQIILVTNLLCF